MLESKRILLRSVEETDLLSLLELQWDADLMRHMIFKPLSLESQKQWFKSLGNERIAFSVFFKQGDTHDLVGLATLNNINFLHQRATWGMKLLKTNQGKGIGYEASVMLLDFAYSHLNINKIQADVIEENTVSCRLADKVGATREGLMCDYYFQMGSFRNAILYGLTREVFYKINGDYLKSLRD